MFRRLLGLSGSSETFQNSQSDQQGQQGQQGDHMTYLQNQEKYFKTMPNLIAAGFSGLPNFDAAIQSAEANRTGIQNTAIDFPNDIFRKVPSNDLADKLAYCSGASLDELIASKNPADAVGCGWLYTAPPANSPYPMLSKGFLGKADGPIQAFNPPSHKQWFFDVQDAKRQVLIDKCKALKSCNDVENEAFKGVCGYCTHTNQGIPIDRNGQPLYPSDPRGGCDSQALVRSVGRCPPPPPPASGPLPMVDRTCDPIDGRLGTECLRRQIVAGGCNERGALALALAGSPPANDYVSRIRDSDAVKMYQRVSQLPLNMDIFRQGRTTTQQVLQEVRQLATNTLKSEGTGIGLAARDLCLRQGAFQAYDVCSELSDGSTAPFDLPCLQQLFLKMGGAPKGKKYPNMDNYSEYNAMGTWGTIKQYLKKMYGDMYASTPSGPLKESFVGAVQTEDAYSTQRQAMIDFLGIVPEKAIERVPYRQGVEVFWFVVSHANQKVLRGFLRRTIERDFVQLQAGPSRAAQIAGPCAGMIQLTDIRTPEAASVKFSVTVDDGFWIAVNHPKELDKKAMNQRTADEPGFFENNGLQGPTTYTSTQCTALSPSTPNIAKVFFQDAGCGWNAFLMSTIPCSGPNPFQKPYYSLTLEEGAPFLSFEVNRATGQFEELRNPAMFSLWINQPSNAQSYYRTDERQLVPGKKGFVRMNSLRSAIRMDNIAYQSWKTVSFAVRFQSMPVRETLIGFAMGAPGMAEPQLYYNIIATGSGGNSVTLSVEHSFGGRDTQASFRSGFKLNKWYLIYIHNRGTQFDLYCNDIAETVRTKGRGGGFGDLTSKHKSPLYGVNATWNPAPGQKREACTLVVGTQGFVGNWKSFYATSAFEYDVAWVHFFDQIADNADIYRECMGNWKYTQFPVAYQQFQTITDDGL